MNAELAIQLLIALVNQAGTITALLQRAKDEGRDVTDAELDALRTEDDAARALLVEAIAKARAGT